MVNKNAYDDEELFDLEWGVCPDGYKILKATAILPPQVSKKIFFDNERYFDEIVPCSERIKKYNPFAREYAGIAKEFAHIDIDVDKKEVCAKEAIKFANRYGLLGLDFSNERSEKVNDWYKPIFNLKEIYGLVDMGYPDDALMMFNYNRPTPRLSLTIAKAQHKRHRFLEIRPTSLYGALWILTADKISRGNQLQRCQNDGCGIWFPKKSNKKCCSSRCKMALRRKILSSPDAI